IRQCSVGIYDMSGEIVASDLNIYQVDYGILAWGNEFIVRDSHISATLECIRGTDTDGSRVTNTNLLNTPVTLYLSHDTQNHVLFDNCTGEEENSRIMHEGCYANWTWPLQVNVWDEMGEPQPSLLSVRSPVFGEVYNDTIDGGQRIDALLGWWSNFSGNHDVKDYTVRVQDSENTETDNPTMLSFQISEFIFNHGPTTTPSAPDEVSFDEDTTWSEDISDWFQDRDALSFEIVSVSGSNIAASIDGNILSLENTGSDLFGDGDVHLKAVDTFDAEVHHTLDVHILPVNDPPITLPLPMMNISEDTSGWINLSGYAVDIDSIDLSWSNGTADNFTIEWTAPLNVTITPDNDWFGLQNITFMVTDGEHVRETVLVVNVTPVNDAPVWSGDAVMDITVNAGEDKAIDINGLFNDVDNEAGELIITFDSDHAAYSDGIVTVNYPANTENMTEMIAVTISDGDLSTSFQLNVTVIEREIPDEEWNIDDSEVSIDPETGNWTVTVSGEEGQDVYIVIDGVGSFKLEETSPGEYSVEIPGSDFEEGVDYSYHFSDTEGGEDRTGGEHTGSVTQPTPADDDDMDDDDDSDKDEGFPIWIVILGIIIAVLIAVIAFLIISNRSRSDYYDDELEE
ncbi:MAG: Ig-like domain-containing protein, partial [Candidatus Thermoplasmatota archaeon]|nr:Ig-like domain-containing protein [Candidatus Thermoplasmatota archaeon]